MVYVTEWEFWGILITLGLSAWFAGIETVFLSFERMLIPSWQDKKKKWTKIVAMFVEKPERFLVVVLLGNNLVNVIYSSITTTWLTELGVSQKIILIVAPLFVMIFGEIVPKTIGFQKANSLIRFGAFITYLQRFGLYPFARPLEKFLLKAQHKLGIPVDQSRLVFSRADIAMVLRKLDAKSTNNINNSFLANGVIRLGELKVYDIMTPRNRVIAVSAKAKINEIRNIIVKSGFSRLPVYENSIDNVIGLIRAKDILYNPADLKNILKPVETIPDNLSALNLLIKFRTENVVFASVVDEYGGFAGVVTIEDIIEVLFGPIRDEYDVSEVDVKKIRENVYIVEGKVKLSHLAATGIWEAPDEIQAITIGGLLMEHAGTIPKDSRIYQIRDAKIKVLKSSARGIELLMLTIDKPIE